MRNICIVYKNDEAAARLALETAERLRRAGRRVWLETSEPGPRPWTPDDFEPDLIISLGGDGTLLYAVRAWGLGGAPLLGVNMGQLGFLAETELEYFEPLLEETLAGRFRLEVRSTLEVRIKGPGRADDPPMVVLNDAVINKGHLARVMQILVTVPGYGSWNYRADGLIIATPTGSTAYNLSAGGPVVYPSLPAVIVTPICPFSLSSRPLILPADFTIEVTLDPKAEDIHFSGDGQVSLPLSPDDLVQVRLAPRPVNLLINPHRHFLDILRHKLGWTLAAASGPAR